MIPVAAATLRGVAATPGARVAREIVTGSLGVVSLVPSEQGAPDDVVAQADSALYLAKQSGRDCLRTATG